MGLLQCYYNEQAICPRQASLLYCTIAGVAVLTVEDLGRRPLLLIGVSSMVVSLLALGGSQLVLTGQAETWTSVAALLLYVGAYQVYNPLSTVTTCIARCYCVHAKIRCNTRHPNAPSGVAHQRWPKQEKLVVSMFSGCKV